MYNISAHHVGPAYPGPTIPNMLMSSSVALKAM